MPSYGPACDPAAYVPSSDLESPNNQQIEAPTNQPPSSQSSGSQSTKTYPVRRTSAVLEMDESGDNTLNSAGSRDNAPSGPNPSLNAPPVPPEILGGGNANSAAQPAAGGGSSSANSSCCESCAGSCQSNGCDSCNQCNSCGCDSCHHKCLPLIHIDECCPLQCEDEPVDHLFGNCCCLKQNDLTITGWIDAGIMGNGRNTADGFNGPLTFADRNGEGQANQVWFSFDRSAPANNCGWFLGGHVDYFYGSDFFFATAAGLDGTPNGDTPRWNSDPRLLYGSAMPQLYVETDYDDWKIKWGHFLTPLGYEAPPAIANFFYSHSYTFQYGEPFTHTGFLVTKPTGDNWTWNGGLVAGWNTFDTDDRAAWLGGVTYADKDWGSLAFEIITGQDSELNLPGVGPFADRTLYSLVWTRNFTSRFTYVLQHDLGNQNDAITARGGGAQWYGINQYLFYKLNCCWTAGMRIEWFRDDDGFVVTTARPGNADNGASFPGNFYEITLGLNYKPNSNLAIRPEVRWDWYDGQPNQSVTNPPVTSPYNAGTANNQLTFGVDLVTQW